MDPETIDGYTHIHICECGEEIRYTGHDHGGRIACSCGKKYEVEQIDGYALIFERGI